MFLGKRHVVWAVIAATGIASAIACAYNTHRRWPGMRGKRQILAKNHLVSSISRQMTLSVFMHLPAGTQGPRGSA
jgi:hypothetical protein